MTNKGAGKGTGPFPLAQVRYAYTLGRRFLASSFVEKFSFWSILYLSFRITHNTQLPKIKCPNQKLIKTCFTHTSCPWGTGLATSQNFQRVYGKQMPLHPLTRAWAHKSDSTAGPSSQSWGYRAQAQNKINLSLDPGSDSWEERWGLEDLALLVTQMSHTFGFIFWLTEWWSELQQSQVFHLCSRKPYKWMEVSQEVNSEQRGLLNSPLSTPFAQSQPLCLGMDIRKLPGIWC